MDGSEPGDSVAAAVLSGAPVELQARTVRYVFRRSVCSPSDRSSRLAGQNLSTFKASYAIRRMAWSPLANGLGRVRQGLSLGESSDGLAVKR